MRQATAESPLCAVLSSNAYETSTSWTIPAIGLDTKTWLAVMVFGMSRSCMVVLEKCIIGDIQKKSGVEYERSCQVSARTGIDGFQNAFWQRLLQCLTWMRPLRRLCTMVAIAPRRAKHTFTLGDCDEATDDERDV